MLTFHNISDIFYVFQRVFLFFQLYVSDCYMLIILANELTLE